MVPVPKLEREIETLDSGLIIILVKKNFRPFLSIKCPAYKLRRAKKYANPLYSIREED
jgi:hypothetical protein